MWPSNGWLWRWRSGVVEAVALGALALDAAIGWPGWLYRRIGHPVGLFACIIASFEQRWNRPELSAAARRLLGLLAMLLLLMLSVGSAMALERAIRMIAGDLAWLFIALAAWPALAQRSLLEHVDAVICPLANGDLVVARQAVGRIVGRDTAMLDEAGVSRATIESLAESLSDGVIAPLFWLLLCGLPGIWAYKAINTADSLIGHPEEPFRAYGWAAARIDDLANLAPARLSALLICLAGFGGWRIVLRDHGRHASPNAGWPEAAMAGALAVRLGGPVVYDGMQADKPWLGDRGLASVHTVRAARTVYLRACALAWCVTGGITWLA